MNNPTHGAVFTHVLVGTLRARMARLSTHDPMCGRCPTHGGASFIYQRAALFSCTCQRAALSSRAWFGTLRARLTRLSAHGHWSCHSCEDQALHCVHCDGACHCCVRGSVWLCSSSDASAS